MADRHHRRGKPGSFVDPVGAIARAIVKTGSDFSFGKPSQKDFVMDGVRVLGLENKIHYDDPIVEHIADKLYEDCGEVYSSEQQMAAFIYAELTESVRAVNLSS